MFEDDARLHNALNNYVRSILYNDYNGVLWDADYINNWDREELGENFVSVYMNECDDLSDMEDADKERLSVYAAKEIDRLIPKLYFMELNYELSRKYTPILVRRIYDTNGKDGYEETSKIQYQFDHDFSEIEEKINESAATEKQINYLKKLGKNSDYLLWHEEYLTKTYANQMIEYLSEKSYIEPAIFEFFFVSK